MWKGIDDLYTECMQIAGIQCSCVRWLEVADESTAECPVATEEVEAVRGLRASFSDTRKNRGGIIRHDAYVRIPQFFNSASMQAVYCLH